jgi:hypothetical protein
VRLAGHSRAVRLGNSENKHSLRAQNLTILKESPFRKKEIFKTKINQFGSKNVPFRGHSYSVILIKKLRLKKFYIMPIMADSFLTTEISLKSRIIYLHPDFICHQWSFSSNAGTPEAKTKPSHT